MAKNYKTPGVYVEEVSTLPPRLRASSQLNSAVRAPPICRKPVGDGANRATMGVEISVMVQSPDHGAANLPGPRHSSVRMLDDVAA